MATQVQDDMLHSGDLVGFEYLIKPGANETLLGLAIKRVKDDLWADRRFDYQGSYEETRTNKSGLDGAIIEERYLIINVIVRQYPRGERPTEQQAGVGAIVVVLATLAAILAGSLAVYSVFEYKGAVVHKQTVEAVLNSDLPPEAKADLLNKSQPQSKSIGTGIAAFGGSLVTAAIIIGVLWALSLSKARGLSD